MNNAQKKYVLETTPFGERSHVLECWEKLELVLATIGGYVWLSEIEPLKEPAAFIKRCPRGNIWVGVRSNSSLYFHVEMSTKADDRPVVLHAYDDWSLERALVALESQVTGG